MQHRAGYARGTQLARVGSDTALRTGKPKNKKARSPFGTSGLFGEGRGIYTTLSEILGRKLNAGS